MAVYDLNTEEWRDIKGYNGYQVSNNGNVRHLNFGKKGLVRNLKPILKSTGYYVVTLFANKKGNQVFIHRLVAEAFIDHTDKSMVVVDHINTITTDNRVENLRWATIKQNVNNPISKSRRTLAIQKMFKGKYGIMSPKHRACIQKDLDGNIIKVWGCMSDASRQLGIDTGSLTRVCQGKQLTANGYRWEYYDL